MKEQDPDFTRLRARAEDALAKARRLDPSAGDVDRAFHDLDVYHAELLLQNEELTVSREAQRIASERYRELYDLCPVAYFSTSSQGVVLDANRQALLMCERPKESIVGRSIALALHTKDDELALIVHRVVSMRLPVQAEVVIQQGASVRHAIVSARPQTEESEPCILLALSDITALREAEHRQRMMEQQAIEGERVAAVARVASSVAHDVNNLLAAVTSLAECARDGAGVKTSDIDAILDACKRGSRLMRSMLSVASVAPPSARAVDICSVVASVASMLRRANRPVSSQNSCCRLFG
jgi:PAS domain S-box-containing protein